MPDSYGFIQNQQRSDVSYFDGVQWRRSNEGVPNVTGKVTISGGALGTPGQPSVVQVYGLVVQNNMAAPSGSGQDNNAAIFGISYNNGTAQPIGIRGAAVQTGSGDACAIYGSAVGGSGAVYGGFAISQFGATAKSNYGGFGFNPVIVNDSNLGWSYDGVSTAGPAGQFIQCLASANTSGAKRTGAGISITTLGGDPTKALWDVGVGFWTDSIYNADLYSKSSPNYFAYVAGTHGTGIDWTPGTISGDYQKFPAFTTYTPTITASVGTLTTASGTGRYLREGKRLTIQITATITNNGTGSGIIIATLPNSYTAAANYTLVGRDSSVTGNILQGYIASGANTVWILFYNNGYPGAGGAVLNVNGVIEIA